MNVEIEAQNLIDRFKDYVATDYQYNEEPILECQKQCALIVVDEILKELVFIKEQMGLGLGSQSMKDETDFWQSVKSQLLKM